LYNLVGGKIEIGEDGYDAAYRELLEETGIIKGDIKLSHLMEFTYYLSSIVLEVYVGRLNKEVTVEGDENELCWLDLSSNFFDMSVFAGEGNIGHILEQVKIYEDKMLVL
jgi:8-oxo-dGTP diphosphatase